MKGPRGSEPLLVGLDVGTTAAKAGLFDTRGAVLATAAVPYEIRTPEPGWAEQDPRLWWEASSRAIRDVLAAGSVDAGSVVGLGLSGQMHGSVFLDHEGEVIRPCILWCDQRSAPQCSWIEERIGGRRLNEWVSNPALAGFTAPKVLWLRENEPDNYARVRTLLLPKDYVNFRICGNRTTDVSDAAGTLLFDVRRRRWSESMVEALDLPDEWLPPVYDSSEAVGSVTREAAESTGLMPGTTVAAGGADNACSAVGMGVISPGDLAVSVGTSGTVLAPTVGPVADEEMRLHCFNHAVPSTWYLMGVTLSAGASLRWFRGELGQPERSEADRLGKDPYELLDSTAAQAPAGCGGLVFLPYLSGERTPHSDPCARGVMFGIDLTKKRPHLVRAVMEGVVFALNDSVRLMRGLKVPISRVVAGGGGSRSRLWLQMEADVFGLPVQTAGFSDTAVLGAALLGGVAAGVFDSVEDACESAVSYGEPLNPDPGTREAYAASYEVFRALYPALRDLFKAAGQMGPGLEL